MVIHAEKFGWKRYVLPALLALLMVALAALISQYFVEDRFSSTDTQLEKVQQDLQENKLALLYVETFKDQNNFCQGFKPLINQLINQTNRLGDHVYALEQTEDQNNSQLLDIKRTYTLQNLELWLYFVNLKKQCQTNDSNFHTILYFYTNQPGSCLDCKAQEIALADYREKNPDSWVFAFEGKIGLSLIETLKQQYQIDSYPSLVIDENQRILGYHSEEELITQIKNNHS